MTPLNISGLAITLLGIGLYNVLKYQQSLKGSTCNEADQEGLIVLKSRNDGSQTYSKLNDHKLEEEEGEEDDDGDDYDDNQINHTPDQRHRRFMSENIRSDQYPQPVSR